MKTSLSILSLLLLLAVAELPEGASPEEKAAFDAGHGGALVPTLCVDKSPQDLRNFVDFSREAYALGQPWQMLFVSTLSGANGKPPAASAVDQALERMTTMLQAGDLSRMLAFNTEGQAVQLG